MKTNIEALKPKHDKGFIIDLNEAKAKDAMKKLTFLQVSASMYLAAILATLNSNNKVSIPCKRCLLDVALEFEEIGSLIRELVDGK